MWGLLVSKPVKKAVKTVVKAVTDNEEAAIIAGCAAGAFASHLVHDHASATLEYTEMSVTIIEVADIIVNQS